MGQRQSKRYKVGKEALHKPQRWLPPNRAVALTSNTGLLYITGRKFGLTPQLCESLASPEIHNGL